MSYLMNFIKKISYRDSFTGRITEILMNPGIGMINGSRIIRNIIFHVKQSTIFSFLMNPEKEAEILEDSKIVDNGIEFSHRNLDRIEKYSGSSRIVAYSKSINNEFSRRPFFVLGLLILSAALANTLLLLILEGFEVYGLVFRAAVIIISCLLIMANNQKILKTSYIARVLR